METGAVAVVVVVAVVVAVAVTVIGASVSGSVIVVSWEVFITEVSKRELASGDMDLGPAVGWEAEGSSCVV